MKYPTRLVGDGTLGSYLNWAKTGDTPMTARTAPVVLVGLVGHNAMAEDCFIQCHAVAALVGLETPLISVLATAGLPYSFALPAPVGFDKLMVVCSTTADSYAITDTPSVSFQALIAA